jgi:hypothetical protein
VGKLTDEKADEKKDAISTNSHTTTWTPIPPKHVEGKNALKTTQITTIQSHPRTTSECATNAVYWDTSMPTELTLKCARDQRNKLNERTAYTSLVTAGDRKPS